MAPSGAVIVNEQVSCKILVTMLGYLSFLGSVLYVTCFLIGNRLLVALALFILVGHISSEWGLLTCGLVAAFPTCIFAASGLSVA